jgi:CubicO group peptidase (beta-lactamase class C family)
LDGNNQETNEDDHMNIRHRQFISSNLAAVVGLAAVVCAQPAIGTGANRPVEWPATPAGRCAKVFFEALNTEGEDALQRFVAQYYSDESARAEELASHLQLRKLAGNLKPHSARSDGDFAIDILAQSRLFGWVKFRIELSSEPPHDVTAMAARPGSPPEAEGPGDYSGWKDLQDLIDRVRRDCGAPGMVAAVVRGGKIIEKAATGVRRADQPGKVHVEDLFHIGSVGKVLTGIMIGKLLESEVLQWDLTIAGALPDLPMKQAYRTVTLEQLLSHRGGVPSLPSTGAFKDGFPADSGRPPAEARAALVRQVLMEEPVAIGEYSYSNAGYVVAAYMVEGTVKQYWEESMHTLVVDPLELRSTGFGWPATKERPDQPHGHYGTPPDLRVQEIGESMLGDLDYIGPAGNLHCSIDDLARLAAFYLRVLNDQEWTLKADTVPRFWRPGKTEDGAPMYGFFGSGGTFMAMITVYPDNDLAVVAATNIGLPALPYFKGMRDAVYRKLACPSATQHTDH